MSFFAQALIADEWWVRVLGPVAGATVTGAVALIIWWLNRKRPNQLEVREVELTSLLKVGETIRPRIIATLDGQPIANLSQIEVAIMNRSLETIKDIAITFRFPQRTTVLECELSGVGGERRIVAPDELTVTIPFLNAYRHHGDVVVAKILCDGEADAFTVAGRGDGWSARRTSIDSIIRFHFTITLGIFASVFIAMVLYMRWVRNVLGLTRDEFSLVLLAALLPMIIFIIAVQYFCLRWLRRTMRRLRK